MLRKHSDVLALHSAAPFAKPQPKGVGQQVVVFTQESAPTRNIYTLVKFFGRNVKVHLHSLTNVAVIRGKNRLFYRRGKQKTADFTCGKTNNHGVRAGYSLHALPQSNIRIHNGLHACRHALGNRLIRQITAGDKLLQKLQSHVGHSFYHQLALQNARHRAALD